MVQKTALQSFSFNLHYSSYEKNDISIKTGDDHTIFEASITRESVFQFTLDIQASTRKEIHDQAKPFLKYLDKNILAPRESTINPELSGQEITLDLFEKDGYWGVEKTAQRIIDFVLNGAGDDLEKLKAGREGVTKGLKEAKKAWGGNLPEISYNTIDKALSSIDEKIKSLDGKIIDIVA